jgi:hypothetical protein
MFTTLQYIGYTTTSLYPFIYLSIPYLLSSLLFVFGTLISQLHVTLTKLLPVTLRQILLVPSSILLYS